jgi:hypothetical protein
MFNLVGLIGFIIKRMATLYFITHGIDYFIFIGLFDINPYKDEKDKRQELDHSQPINIPTAGTRFPCVETH